MKESVAEKAIKRLRPTGYELVIVDAAQIEARVLAWLADEEWILNAFREKRDVYCEFGPEVYGRIITKSDIEERFVLKTAILGLGFGCGGLKFQKTLLVKSIEQGLEPIRFDVDLCYSIVNKYRTKCEIIKNFWKFVNDKFIAAMLTGCELKYKCLRITKGKIHLPNGLALLYPGLDANVVKQFNCETIQNASYLSARSSTKIYGGLLVENLVQALARIIVADVLREISRKYRVVLITHDEIVFVAPKKEAQEALVWAIELMSKPPVWAPELPLSAEGGHSVSYSK